jgi:hypothetical protein
MDRKRRIFRLIEVYLNDFRGSAIEEMYGNGTKIKIHSISDSIKDKSILIEAVIVLGDSINEEVMDRELADVLIQDALVYFYPEYSIKTMVRWDA